MKKLVIIKEGCIKNFILYEKFLDLLNENNLEMVCKIEEADYAIIITCACNQEKIDKGISDLNLFLKVQNKFFPNLKIIVVGCLTKIIKDMDWPNNIKVIRNQDWIKPIINYVNEETLKNSVNDLLDNRTYTLYNGTGSIFNPIHGCLNNCTFCKKNYMDFNVNSIPYENVIAHLRKLINNGSKSILLSGDNLVLYGMDLYKKTMLNSLISELENEAELNSLQIATLVPGNVNSELISTIENSRKIDRVCLHLETGSDRLLKLMKRPYTLEIFDSCVEPLIKKGKLVHSILMTGFPTETYNDMDETIRYLVDHKIYVQNVFSYIDSEYLPSHKLPQYSKEEKKEHYEYMMHYIEENNNKILNSFIDKENKFIYYGKNGDDYLFYSNLYYEAVGLDSMYENLKIGDVVSRKIKKIIKRDNTNKYLI